jgi:hypothetical protein
MLAFYKQFSQGIAVAGCAVMSISTLGYMLNDSHQIEKKQLRSKYENQIMNLNQEINKLKLENMALNSKIKMLK